MGPDYNKEKRKAGVRVGDSRKGQRSRQGRVIVKKDQFLIL